LSIAVETGLLFAEAFRRRINVSRAIDPISRSGSQIP
jgi:hypothetical protein